MSTRRVATIAVVSSLAGLVVGACGASWYWLGFNGKFMASSLVLRTQADIIAKVSVLEHMRAGRTEEAAKLQEILLDGDLVIAGALARDGNGFNANARRRGRTGSSRKERVWLRAFRPNRARSGEGGVRFATGRCRCKH